MKQKCALGLNQWLDQLLNQFIAADLKPDSLIVGLRHVDKNL